MQNWLNQLANDPRIPSAGIYALENNMKPKSPAERQRTYREQQKKLGRRQRLKYLTDKENKAVDQFIAELRKGN